jgi:hypothetical protein
MVSTSKKTTKKRMAIHPHTHNLPLREAGILTVLPVADGEADALPSLLLGYSTTPKAPCQEEFFTFFLYFHRKQASKLGVYGAVW